MVQPSDMVVINGRRYRPDDVERAKARAALAAARGVKHPDPRQRAEVVTVETTTVTKRVAKKAPAKKVAAAKAAPAKRPARKRAAGGSG